VHYGTAGHTRELQGAYTAHPEPFVRKPPTPPKLPTASWINRPDDTEEAAQQFLLNGASFKLTDSVAPLELSKSSCLDNSTLSSTARKDERLAPARSTLDRLRCDRLPERLFVLEIGDRYLHLLAVTAHPDGPPSKPATC